jgi:hypothetical protein
MTTHCPVLTSHHVPGGHSPGVGGDPGVHWLSSSTQMQSSVAMLMTNGAHVRGPSTPSAQVAAHVSVSASPQAVAPSGMQLHGRPGTMASPPQRWPAGQVPLQKGTVAEPHGWLPSGTQPQNGNWSCTNAQVRPASHVPLQLPGPPPHGGNVVLVVGAHPVALHASQQLSNAPTQ